MEIVNRLLFSKALVRLGIGNLIRYAIYVVQKKFGLFRFNKVVDRPINYIFHDLAPSKMLKLVIICQFGWKNIELASPPDWKKSYLRENFNIRAKEDWANMQNFVSSTVDIKEIWDLSRFSWLPEFAHKLEKGESEFSYVIETFLQDWINNNPAYLGVNWMCGQEAAIRVLNLAFSSLILGEIVEPSPTLRWLVLIHLRRVAPTIGYAIAQENNHGSAEAACLFVGSSWLLRFEDSDELSRYFSLGRYWLINRSKVLIKSDGSSSQYSFNYHRSNLEVFVFVEVWRRRFSLSSFPVSFGNRVVIGAKWLLAFIDLKTGDVPNYGANDGSMLFSLDSRDYRDFRYIIIDVARVFDSADVYWGTSVVNQRSRYYSSEDIINYWTQPKQSELFNMGYYVLRRNSLRAFVFSSDKVKRPGHADCLHVDFWNGSVPLLKDGGSFSYGSDGLSVSKVSAHNTVQFDGKEQLIEFRTFLYGEWPRSISVGSLSSNVNFEMMEHTRIDHNRSIHSRTVKLFDSVFVCIDHLSGAGNSATLRWRLSSEEWKLTDFGVECDEYEIVIRSSKDFKHSVKSGSASLYYKKIDTCPVLNIISDVPAVIETKFLIK